jgi:hypothetical protein
MPEMQYPPTTLPAALGRLHGAHEALCLAIAEISERDARIAALEAAIAEALRLHRAGCGDAVTALREVLRSDA